MEKRFAFSSGLRNTFTVIASSLLRSVGRKVRVILKNGSLAQGVVLRVSDFLILDASPRIVVRDIAKVEVVK